MTIKAVSIRTITEYRIRGLIMAFNYCSDVTLHTESCNSAEAIKRKCVTSTAHETLCGQRKYLSNEASVCSITLNRRSD